MLVSILCYQCTYCLTYVTTFMIVLLIQLLMVLLHIYMYMSTACVMAMLQYKVCLEHQKCIIQMHVWCALHGVHKANNKQLILIVSKYTPFSLASPIDYRFKPVQRPGRGSHYSLTLISAHSYLYFVQQLILHYELLPRIRMYYKD